MKIKKLLKTFGIIVLSAGMFSNVSFAANYVDVGTGDWHYDYVHYVSDKGIMTGLNATTFGPGEGLARAQFATILHRMAGQPQAAGASSFADVPAGAWYYDAISWASSVGIVTGYTATNTFDPNKAITREEIATMMHRFAKYAGKEEAARADLSGYPDKSGISSFANEAVQWAVAHEIMKGTNGLLSPQVITNRAECATIIQRYLENDWVVSGSDNNQTTTPPVEQPTNPPTDQQTKPPVNPQVKPSVPEGTEEGRAVVDYARQWIGKTPYVYAGNSLETGTDCSGFVQLVYAKFGITLPRPTWEQDKVGVEVKEADMQPGDLVFFKAYEHVGIYSGNGNFIHAATEEKGTVEEPLTWMGPIKTVRRVLQ